MERSLLETKLNKDSTKLTSPPPSFLCRAAKILQDIFIGLDLVAVPSTDVQGDCYEDIRFSVAVYVSSFNVSSLASSPRIWPISLSSLHEQANLSDFFSFFLSLP